MTNADWLRLLALSVLWGGSFFFVQVAVPYLPPLTIVWLRVAMAGGVLGLVLALSGKAPPRGWRVWGTLLVMGFLNNAVPFTLFAVAQGEIASGLAAVLNATAPLFTVIVAHLATRDERLTGAKALGLAFGFAGVVVMMGGAALTEAGVTLAAQAACLGAALSYALAGVWGRRFARMGVAPLQTAFGQVAASSLLILPLMLAVDRPWTLAPPPVHVIGALAGLAMLSTALAYLIYFRLLASAGATNLLLVTFLIPVSAILLGVLILGEALLVRQLAGFALIALGLAAIDGRLVRAARR